MTTSNHPCFNVNARKQFGRIHLPVAPTCTVQCRFCNRQYDCLNESRPGVTSTLLSPGQALIYLERSLAKHPYISVAGIAGPGDALARPELTLETLELIRKKYSGLLLCLATNGLTLKDWVNDLAALRVSHVTVTVNAVDPGIGTKIYAWVRNGKRVLRGDEGAEILLERQKAGIQALKEKGITVKVNSIVIPQVNEDHTIAVAKEVRSWGADFFNAIPLLPVENTEFGSLPQPDNEKVQAIRNEAEAFIPQMRHCARCRSDAAGLLGEKEIGDIARLLHECSNANEAMTESIPVKDEKRPYVAVASREGLLVNVHFGQAESLYIFGKGSDDKYSVIEKRATPPKGADNRWERLAAIIGDCRAVMVNSIGGKPQTIMAEKDIAVLEMEGLIETGLDAIYEGKRKPPSPSRKKCGATCSGGGCG